MRKISILYDELKSRKDFEIIGKGIDGGMGLFNRGSLCNYTVVWSYGGGWEHVSMCGCGRTPTWEEMCAIKDMFWNEDETVVQFHPAKENYVNNASNCLHLWKPIEKYSGKLPIPPSVMVGTKEWGTLE